MEREGNAGDGSKHLKSPLILGLLAAIGTIPCEENFLKLTNFALDNCHTGKKKVGGFFGTHKEIH